MLKRIFNLISGLHQKFAIQGSLLEPSKHRKVQSLPFERTSVYKAATGEACGAAREEGNFVGGSIPCKSIRYLTMVSIKNLQRRHDYLLSTLSKYLNGYPSA